MKFPVLRIVLTFTLCIVVLKALNIGESMLRSYLWKKQMASLDDYPMINLDDFFGDDYD